MKNLTKEQIANLAEESYNERCSSLDILEYDIRDIYVSAFVEGFEKAIELKTK